MRTTLLTIAATSAMLLAGCAGQFVTNTAALHPIYPVPGIEGSVVAGPTAVDAGSGQMLDVVAGGGAQAMTPVVSGGHSMVLMPPANGQGMPQSTNSLPVGAANPY